MSHVDPLQDGPLAFRFSLEGREALYPIPPYQTPEEALQDMMEKLGAIALASPIFVRTVMAKELADYITETGSGQKLFDLINSVNVLYNAFNQPDRFKMTDETDNSSEETPLDLVLRKVEFLIASGQSKPVSLEEEEEFLHNLVEKTGKLKNRFKLEP